MIVDKLQEDSRGGEGLLDGAAGEGGLMTSPLNLAYFYGGSPPAAALGASEACFSSSGHSTPGSPGSDSSDFSSSSSVSTASSCSAVGESRARGGPRADRVPGEHHMAGGRQQRGPFQGVRVRNSVKELLLHIRSSKQKSPAPPVDDLKAQSVTTEQFPELKTILTHSGKRKGTEPISDGPVCKRPTISLQTQILTPPQTPTPVDSMEDVHINEPKQNNNSDLLQNIMNIKNESSPVSLNTVQFSWMSPVVINQNSPREQYQDFHRGQILTPPQKYQPFPVSSPPQVMEQSQMYQFSSQSPDLQQPYSHVSVPECSPYSGKPQSSAFESNLFDGQDLLFCPTQSFASLLSGPGEPENIAVPIQTSPGAQQQQQQPQAQPNAPINTQNFNLGPNSVCDVLRGQDPGVAPLNVSLPLRNTTGNSMNTTQLGKSFFQWQVEQEESKLANLSQDHFLSKDADGDTLLHIAVAQGRRALSYVLARKMSALQMLDIKEHNGQSAFQVAVAANQHLIVQDLVNLGAQVNTTDCWGRTPLHVCAEKGHSQVLQAIQKGAICSNQFIDLEATNYDGLTALHCAVVAHNAVVHELQRNQQHHSPEVQELLLKNKSLVDTIKCLIQMGATVEAKDRKSGRTALHLAAEEANLELIRFFLELPSCLSFVNAKAYNGNTALHVAASLQYRVTQLDAVRLLMRKGADPSTRNLENEQPVHLVPDGPVGEQIRRILKGKSVQQRAPPY
ncbi:NF-kappa-B inhibitor zeta isoform X2 [Monodelphis domestica]|uniref:NF-kappa-B inhibitor zeta isoform X2 n=1 Tax=Monodelphis domestica TaxID=13616 RepID=UPI0024E1C3B5|nr:NF-kappa-B inhibitor zeta isoform X2 [Monodelphis domestica]